MEVQVWLERVGEGGKRTRYRWDGREGTSLDDLLRTHRDALQVIADRRPKAVEYADVKDWVSKFTFALLEAGHVCDVSFDTVGSESAFGVVVWCVPDAESAVARRLLDIWEGQLKAAVDCHEHELAYARKRLGAYERAVAGLLRKRDTP